MTITEIIDIVLDTINRPNDELWRERTKAFVVQSFNRLGQKLLFEPLDVNLEVINVSESALTSTKSAIKVILAKPYIQSIYSEKLKDFLTVEVVEKYADVRQDVNKVYRVGTTYYFNKGLIDSNIYFFYTNQIKVDKDSEQPTDYLALECFNQAFDFIYYDVQIRLHNLLNTDLDRISYLTSLRDEAYLDLISWAHSINDKGMLELKG